jgi:hypothetical protein
MPANGRRDLIRRLKVENQRRCSVLVQTTVISPAMTNLLTRAGKSCLPFQNRVANEEDKTAGKAVLFYVIHTANFLVFHILSQQNALIKIQ